MSDWKDKFDKKFVSHKKIIKVKETKDGMAYSVFQKADEVIDFFESLLSKQREELVKQVEGLKKKHRITSEEHGFVQSNEVINIIDNVLSLLKGDV